MRVVVAEDTMITREGIVRLLGDAGIQVIAAAADAEQLMREVTAGKPDAALIDIRMPPTHTDEGLRAAASIRAEHPGIAVLLLSHYVEPEYAMKLLSEHTTGVGYLLKEKVFDVEVLVDALRRITDNETVIDPTIVTRLFSRHRHTDPLVQLTDREREVLSRVAEGLSNQAIAQRLFVAERTVEAHITAIFAKLGLTDEPGSHRRVLSVLAFLRN